MSNYGVLISVVITVYNYGQYVSRALSSVLNQTYKNFEVVVIDDGSSDDSRDQIFPYLVDSRVRYIYQDNAGHPKAKNKGIKESQGEFIAFLDADDVWYPTKLEKQIQLFRDPSVGVVYSLSRLLFPDDSTRATDSIDFFRGDVLNNIFIDNFVCFSSSIVRKSCFDVVGIFDESISMNCDYDLWIRLASHFHFDYINEELVLYRVGHVQMSKNSLKTIQSALMIMNKSINDPYIKLKLKTSSITSAYAMTYCSESIVYRRSGDNFRSICAIFRSLKLRFYCLRTWKQFVKLILQKF